MSNTKAILESQIGVKYLTDEYLKKIRINWTPYHKEVNEEAERIFNKPSESRSIFQIHKVCELGKIPEVILRELDGEYFTNSVKQFHDLIDYSGDHIECKRWKSSQIESNIQNFLHYDAKTYNTSRWLAIYTYDETHTWLDRVIEIDRKKLLTESTIISNEFIEVFKCGKSFTIKNKQCRTLNKESGIRFIDGSKIKEKSVSWFLNNRRLSKDGENWYVFQADL